MGALSVNSRYIYIYIFAGDVDDSMIRILCMTESKKSDWDGRWVIWISSWVNLKSLFEIVGKEHDYDFLTGWWWMLRTFGGGLDSTSVSLVEM